MNKIQDAGYMGGQAYQPMSQTQMNPRLMQTAAPTGTTPLASQMPFMPSPRGAGPSVQPRPSAGMMPATSSITPLAASMPLSPGGQETPVTVASPYYTAGFLKNFIGRNIRVEFLLGTTGTLSDRIGTLLEVGASYIVIQPYLTDDLLMCDLYSIRFVTIIY